MLENNKRNLKSLFHIEDLPTIHADGLNDDSAGWIAAVENRRVLFDGKIYEEGESLSIRREMRFNLNILTIGEGEQVPLSIDDSWVVAVMPEQNMRDIWYITSDKHGVEC